MNKEVNLNIENRVLVELSAERARQDKKFGVQDHNDFHWVTIISEEVGEAAKEALDARFKTAEGDLRGSNECQVKLREELIQVAAVAIAAIESIDRRWMKPKS